MLYKRNIEVDASAGGDLHDTIREAVIMAATERTSVSFEFNGTPVKASTQELEETIYADWQEDRAKQQEKSKALRPNRTGDP